jgi:hypothetical protein
VNALPYVFATLIGVFITPDGVVVGADTAVSNRGGQVSTREKYCVTGPRTVATLQGVYELIDTESKTSVVLYDHFRQICAEIDRTRLPQELPAQAQVIAEMVRMKLTAFLQTVPAADVVARYASSPLVARIAVSGYDHDGPGSVVLGVGVAADTKTARWETRVSSLRGPTFDTCGVRFHGQDVVLSAVRSGTDVRIPLGERQKDSVVRLSAAMRGGCGATSVTSAPELFREATRLTMALGISFGIPRGAVNVPLDIVVIPSDGSIAVSRLQPD